MSGRTLERRSYALSQQPAPIVRAQVVGAVGPRRKALCEALGAVHGVQIVAIGASVADAERRAGRREVDLVVLDTDVPDVLAAARAIKDACPLVNVRFARGTHRVTDADVILSGASGVFEVRAGAMTRAEVLGVAAISAPTVPPKASSIPANDAPAHRELIALGASVGGRAALSRVLSTLRVPEGTAAVITQHVDVHHASSLLESLARATRYPVRTPVSGERVVPGLVYVASSHHLIVERSWRGLTFRLDDGPPEHGCKPAVDPMFRSIADACGASAVGVVLTGMGSDGSRGARRLREEGAPVIVQDAASSVAWGMGGATVALGAASVVTTLARVAREIERWCE